MENVKSGTIMENVKSEDLVTSDWLEKFGVQKFIFERLYNAKGSKEITIQRFDNYYDIRIGNGKDDNLFYNKNEYELEEWFGNGLLYLKNYHDVLILDKQGNVVFRIHNYQDDYEDDYGVDNSDLFERFSLSIPIKAIWEARDSKISSDDLYKKYERSQGYEW